MTTFTYSAIHNKKEVKGQIESISEQDAIKQLRNQGYYVLQISSGIELKTKLLQLFNNVLPSQWLPVKKSAYIQLYRQLSLMLMSGHTLLEALQLSAELASQKKLEVTLLKLKDEIQKGRSFAEALALFPKRFPSHAVELVRSAEASGELDLVLQKLAQEQERSNELKRQLITAMIYPCIVMTMTLGLLVLMAVWVLPKMKTFIEGRSINLPASTQKMIVISDFITNNGANLIIGIFLTIIAIAAYSTTKSGKFLLDQFLLKLPLIGNAIVTATMARVAWTLSLMVSSGVTIIDAVRICQKTVDNTRFKLSFNNAEQHILNGSNLASALKQPYIPELFYKMASVGEKSGELDRVMEEIGTYYSQELQAGIKRLLAFIEPALLLMVGGPVAFVYLSIFQLIFAVSSGGQ